MFLCQIELVSYINPSAEPRYLVVATYGFDPGLQKGEEAYVTAWKVWGTSYDFKVKVLERKKEIYPDGRVWLNGVGDSRRSWMPEAYSSTLNALSKGGSLMLLRIFVEAEDRDKVLEISEMLRKTNNLD